MNGDIKSLSKRLFRFCDFKRKNAFEWGLQCQKGRKWIALCYYSMMTTIIIIIITSYFEKCVHCCNYSIFIHWNSTRVTFHSYFYKEFWITLHSIGLQSIQHSRIQYSMFRIQCKNFILNGCPYFRQKIVLFHYFSDVVNQTGSCLNKINEFSKIKKNW